MLVFDKGITSFCLSPHGCTDHMNNIPGFLLRAQSAKIGRTSGCSHMFEYFSNSLYKIQDIIQGRHKKALCV